MKVDAGKALAFGLVLLLASVVLGQYMYTDRTLKLPDNVTTDGWVLAQHFQCNNTACLHPSNVSWPAVLTGTSVSQGFYSNGSLKAYDAASEFVSAVNLDDPFFSGQYLCPQGTCNLPLLNATVFNSSVSAVLAGNVNMTNATAVYLLIGRGCFKHNGSDLLMTGNCSLVA